MMLPENTQEKLISEIELFIEYGVVDEEKKAAKDLLGNYLGNPIALAALLEFYRVLPETREEAVTKLARLDSFQGVTLLAASTANFTYTVVVSENEAHILGEYEKDETPREVLNYFGYSTHDEFVKSCGPVEEMQELDSGETEKICPACGVNAGELHLLGCPVEICPWCDGQLSNCNCRFEKMEVESITTEEQVDDFHERLEKKGRIPFATDQKPAYPGTSKGLDTESED